MSVTRRLPGFEGKPLTTGDESRDGPDVEKTTSELMGNKELAGTKIGSLVVWVETPVCGKNLDANRL